jgi:PAS domain S-box-containing protein
MDFEKMTKAELIEALKALYAIDKADRSGNEPQHLMHELQVHQIELEMQNRELRATQQLLEESRDRYADLYDFAPVGYATFDDSSSIQEINLAGAALLGVERSHLLGQDFTSFVVEHDKGKFRNHLQQCLEARVKVSTEVGLAVKDGQTVEVQLQSVAYDDAEKQGKLFRSVITDISKSKRLQAELREREQRLKAIFTEAAVGICEADLEGRFLAVNEKFCDISGYSRDELLVRRFQDLTHPDDVQADVDLYRRVQAGELQTYTLEKRYIRKDGAIVWINLTVSLIRDVLGNPQYGIGVVEDITARKQAEEEIRQFNAALEQRIHERTAQLEAANQMLQNEIIKRRESEERYRTLVEASPNAIMVEARGKLVYINPSGLKILGYDSLAELEGLGLKDLLDKPSSHLLEKFKQAKKRQPVNTMFAGKIIRKDGRLFEVDIMFTETIYKGKPAIRTVARDITEIKNLRQAAQHLERLAWIGEFAATVAHEIRNPLGAIALNFKYLAERTKLPQAYQKKFQNIELAIARMQEIVKGILGFARPQAPVLKNEDLHKALDSSLRAVQDEIEQAGITIIKQYNAAPSHAPIDANQIIQVFVNLFSNAIEAMPSGGQLTIRTASEEDFIEVQIEDTGKGIAPDYLEKVFMPFFTTKTKGVGLGLAVVHKILQQHQAQFFVESQVDVGTKFIIRFSKREVESE